MRLRNHCCEDIATDFDHAPTLVGGTGFITIGVCASSHNEQEQVAPSSAHDLRNNAAEFCRYLWELTHSSKMSIIS